MSKQHPLFIIGAACVCVGICALIWESPASPHQFWQGAVLGLFIAIAALSIDLFRSVSRLYPGLNPLCIFKR